MACLFEDITDTLRIAILSILAGVEEPVGNAAQCTPPSADTNTVTVTAVRVATASRDKISGAVAAVGENVGRNNVVGAGVGIEVGISMGINLS